MNTARNVVTTELVADQPVVVVLHQEEYLATEIISVLEQEPITVEHFTLTEAINSPTVQLRLAAAYKILWITSVDGYLSNPDEVQQACTFLTEHQQVLTVVLPVITTFSEQVPGEIPFLAEVSSLQEELILFYNSYLPSATFLFGQDLLSPQLPSCFLYILCQELQTGSVFAPRVLFHPQTTKSFVKRAVRYFLQPQRLSVLIRGNSLSGERVAHTIKDLYQSYHFTPVSLQFTLGMTVSPIPFSVVENFVTEDSTGPLKEFVQTFPSPQAREISLVWEKLRTLSASPPPQEIQLEPPQQVTSSEITPHLSANREEVVPRTVVTDSQTGPLKEVSTQTAALSETESTISRLFKIKKAEQTPQDPEIKQELNSSTDVAEAAAVDTQSQQTAQNQPAASKQPINFDLHQEIQKVFSETHVATKKKQTTRIQEKKKVFKQKSKKRTALFYGGLAFTGMGLGVLSLSLFFMISVNLLRGSVTTYLVSQVEASEANPVDTGKLVQIERLRKVVELQASTYSTVVSLPAVDDATNLVNLSKGLMTVAESTEQTQELVKKLYAQIVGVDAGETVVTAENLASQSLTAYEKLAALQAELNSAVLPFESDVKASTTLENLEKNLEEKRTSIQSLQQLKPLLPDILGAAKKRTYAVLLQNNQELRPTGGFVEAVALLTFENGTLINSKVLSSYEIDEKIDGTVIAPLEIKQYLNEEGWNFVDSNWDPHFPKAAEQISWFLQKALNTEIDGVVSLDLYGVSQILEATGPLDLPQYNEVLTHKNVQDLFEFHSEVSLVDHSQDYRQQVFDALIKKLITLPPEKAGPLFSALEKNFNSQTMLVAFTKAEELQTMKTLGWSGSLLQPNCPSQLAADTCLVDVIAQVEANVGVNKANYNLRRSIDHAITINATEAAHVRNIIFENTAQTDSWPKGAYRVFTRLYLPSSARLESIFINETPAPRNQVTESLDHERKIVGFYTEVPIKKTVAVEVKYSVQLPAHGDTFSYAFFDQQQPGIGTTPLSVKITSNDSLRPDIIAPQAELNNKTITFSRNAVGHSFFGVKFSQAKK